MKLGKAKHVQKKAARRWDIICSPNDRQVKPVNRKGSIFHVQIKNNVYLISINEISRPCRSVIVLDFLHLNRFNHFMNGLLPFPLLNSWSAKLNFKMCPI